MKILLNKLRPGTLLTALFLGYLAFVACSCLPGVIYETGKSLYWQTGPQELIKSIDEYCEEMIPFDQEANVLLDKGTYINFNGLMAKTLAQPSLNQRTILSNGLLASISETGPEEADLREAADNLIRFYRKQQEKGGDFLFVMAPSKISKYEDVLPVGFTDTDNETADRLIALLEAETVPVLDLRESLKEEGILWEEAFFTTDHHWTPQTGFLAFREITEALAEMGAAEAVDPFYTDEESYLFHTYEDAFLGSAGKRTGKYYAGLDDFTLIEPNFPTDIQVSIPSLEVELRGSYRQVSYDTNSTVNPEAPDYFNDNMYGLYGWGDTALTRWRSESAQVQERILLIGDSFSNVPFSFLPICYSSCDEMDMRYFQEDFEDYYQEYDPQTVVILINPNNCVSEFTDRFFP